ncbi:MAG: hypothetical protein MJA29_09480, partial [Candidatus Omnitrophica bacterium]|nr:hypothetical protein [Candidatus Omnitrophota bacterium]
TYKLRNYQTIRWYRLDKKQPQMNIPVIVSIKNYTSVKYLGKSWAIHYIKTLGPSDNGKLWYPVHDDSARAPVLKFDEVEYWTYIPERKYGQYSKT